jgi:DNA-binding response OmpR family regulator
MEKKHNKKKSVEDEIVLEVNSKQILLVDNEQDVCLAIRENLSRYKHKIDTASNGRDAIELIKEKRHDLYLIDVNLPDMSGFEVVDLILNSYFGANKKIVIIAGEISEEAEMYSINMKCRYLIKPFGIKEVDGILKDIYKQDQEVNINAGSSRIPA